MSVVWIDGDLVDRTEARIGAVTPGVQVGYGVFEALAVIDGQAFALTRHLRRLSRSAQILDLDVGVSEATLRSAVDAVIQANPEASKVRITASAVSDDAPAIVVVNTVVQAAWPPSAHVVVSPYVRNERAASVGAKATSYVDNRLALRAAQRLGADEALLFDTRGHLSEGTASNVFVVVDGELCTPADANGCLGGMTRELLCELVPVHLRDDITLPELRAASEVFITSSTRGVHPVATLDGVALGGCPGPLTRDAAAAFDALVSRTLDP